MKARLIPSEKEDPNFPELKDIESISVKLQGTYSPLIVPDITFFSKNGNTQGYKLPAGKIYSLQIEE